MEARLILALFGLCALQALVEAGPLYGGGFEYIEKREAPPPPAASPYKRDVVWDNFEKRALLAVERRSVPASTQYYTYDIPAGAQVSPTIYYYQLPDGSIQYVQGGSGSYQQQQVVQQQQPQVVQQPSGSSIGNFLSKPFDALGNIVRTTGDVASNIVNLPFSAAREVVSGVGLGDTGVGQLAQGVLNAGEAVLQAPVKVVSAVGQAPFRLASGVVSNLEE